LESWKPKNSRPGYAEFVSQVLKQALLEEPDPERRRILCNRIIDLLAGPAVFFDLQPHPFQERILEKLILERTRQAMSQGSSTSWPSGAPQDRAKP
jgi:hypothetical protein